MEKSKAIKISLILVFILILGTGGFFLWKNSQKTPLDKWTDAEMSLKEDFILRETSEGKIVENKKAKISFEVPVGWIIKEDYSSFFSPDSKFSENRSDVIQQGCKINVDVSYVKTDIDSLENFQKENIDQLSSVISSQEFKRTKVKEFEALAYGYKVESLKMSYGWIEIPYNNNLYSIMLTNSIGEEEKCAAEFNKFLESLSIN